MSLVLLCKSEGVEVVVGLATHLDGRLHVKSQRLVFLQVIQLGTLSAMPSQRCTDLCTPTRTY